MKMLNSDDADLSDLSEIGTLGWSGGSMSDKSRQKGDRTQPRDTKVSQSDDADRFGLLEIGTRGWKPRDRSIRPPATPTTPAGLVSEQAKPTSGKAPASAPADIRLLGDVQSRIESLVASHAESSKEAQELLEAIQADQRRLDDLAKTMGELQLLQEGRNMRLKKLQEETAKEKQEFERLKATRKELKKQAKQAKKQAKQARH